MNNCTKLLKVQKCVLKVLFHYFFQSNKVLISEGGGKEYIIENYGLNPQMQTDTAFYALNIVILKELLNKISLWNFGTRDSDNKDSYIL